MSLDRAEQQRTSEELRANQRLSGASDQQLAEQLDFSTQQVEDTLAVADASAPQDVWLLRDHLEDLVLALGGTPVRYSVLTEQARQSAARWFPLHRRSQP